MRSGNWKEEHAWPRMDINHAGNLNHNVHGGYCGESHGGVVRTRLDTVVSLPRRLSSTVLLYGDSSAEGIKQAWLKSERTSTWPRAPGTTHT